MPRAASTVRSAGEDRAATAKRGVLAHIELVRSFGEALIRGADAYLAEHRISEAESNWRDDFPANIGEANKEFHRALAESMNRVSEVFFERSEARRYEPPHPASTVSETTTAAPPPPKKGTS